MYDGKWWYTYDANGNRTARARNAEHNGNVVNIDKSGEYWEYEWDYHNRLIKVQQFNAPDNAQNVKVEYTYDALNRRIERISRTNTEPEVTQYAYGRNGALAYQKKSISGKDTERTFVYLNNQITAFVDEKQNEAEKKYFTVTDIQGSITEVYDESQNLVWKSGYTAFGILACEVNNSIDFDGLYTGCDYDTETGLTYHWNRWRSEEGNSWLSEDFARDGLNWYGYAGQNPVNFIDVIGLFYYNADGQHSSSENYEKKDITTIHSDESNNANDNLYYYADSDGLKTTDRNKVIYPIVGNSLNLDFGRDYSEIAVQNFKNGHPVWGTIHILDSTCEMIYDTVAAYMGAVALDASITGIGMIGGTIAALNSNSTVVLGKYSSGACGGYTKMAEKLGAKSFQLPNKVYTVLEKVGLGSKINEKWLNGVINSGARILLNSDPTKVTPKDTSAYGMEINHLRNAGYEFIETVEKGIECWEATK